MAGLITAAVTAVKAASLGQMLAAGGSIVSAVGAVQSGKAQGAISEYQASQLEAQGKADAASASLKAENEAKQKRLVLSRARAVGAASGGGQDIPLLGQIEEEGTLRTLYANWEGQEALKGRQAQAAGQRLEGTQYKKAGFLKGATTLLGGGASFFEKYA